MSVVPYDFTIVYLKNGIIHELGGEFSPIAPCPKKGDRLSDFVRSRGGKFEQKIKEIEAQKETEVIDFPILAGDRTAHAKTITHAIIKSKGVIGFRESGWWIAEPMKMVLSLQPDLGRFLRIRASGLDVEAIRQDVLCRCFLNIEDYIGIDPALAMTRMAHEARNQMKRHVRKKLASSQNSLMETVSHDGEWPSEIARTIESLQALKSELEDLSSTERALVLLYISDGKSAEEVALASNLHLRTVYRKINSAVVRLKRAIWNN